MKDPAQPHQPQPQPQHRRRGAWRWRAWILRVGTSVLLWTALMQLTSVVEVWHPPLPKSWPTSSSCLDHLQRSSRNDTTDLSVREIPRPKPVMSHRALRPRRVYSNNGYLLISCNGGLNQMRAAICDMVTIARFLNLTLVVPELDKTSFWNDPSEFGDIFNVKHFISSLRDQVRIIKELPKKLNQKVPYTMPPVSWSNEKYYLKQILPLFHKYKVIHFNRTDARLSNNGLRPSLQRLRCRVNYKALKFTPEIEELGEKLISNLQKRGPFVVLHLRYEMDMLAFSGCTHGCSKKEVKELTRMRYAYPWWKEKEIVSEEKRLDGLCPLTPEEAALVLQAMNIDKETPIYLAAGEIYGGERRLAALRTAYPNLLKKEMLLHHDEIKAYQNHSSQMAALDYLVSIASDVFIPSYDGNMAKVVEGHRRYLGFRKSILLNRKDLVRLIDLFQGNMLSWEQFSAAVRDVHLLRMGQPTNRRVIPDKPKEEDYFYANPEECLGPIISNMGTGSAHSGL